jgi:hypothetical protein
MLFIREEVVLRLAQAVKRWIKFAMMSPDISSQTLPVFGIESP